VNHLLRSSAPISEAGWELLDQEARERLAPALAGRKLIDFTGPHGWEHSATNLGRTARLEAAPASGVDARQRRVLPLVELRADFSISREELRDADRGADDVDLEPLDRAAHHIAVAESAAVFHGCGGALTGIAEASPHREPAADADPDGYPARVAGAVERLLGAGIQGPYGLALGDGEYRQVTAAAEHGGFPLRRHLEEILDGPIVWAPGVDGAVVLSVRGGDFVFDCGQDLSLGYDSHDAEHVHLYLQESFSFHVPTPEAAVALTR
jgi:uncharacterized linocin/CFP29 family protein